jgi:osmotically-inducible protein OsmY
MYSLQEAGLRDLLHRRDVTEMAKDRLQQTAHGPLRNVACDFERGTIVLRGMVPRYYLKQLAQEIVGDLPGVMQVINDIEVCGLEGRRVTW